MKRSHIFTGIILIILVYLVVMNIIQRVELRQLHQDIAGLKDSIKNSANPVVMANDAKPTPDSLASNPYKSSKISVTVIEAPEKTFGYDIYIDGTKMIHQNNIPGVPGIKGFKTKEVAKRVGEKVAEKIRNNQMPPIISKEELIELNAL